MDNKQKLKQINYNMGALKRKFKVEKVEPGSIINASREAQQKAISKNTKTSLSKKVELSIKGLV